MPTEEWRDEGSRDALLQPVTNSALRARDTGEAEFVGGFRRDSDFERGKVLFEAGGDDWSDETRECWRGVRGGIVVLADGCGR